MTHFVKFTILRFYLHIYNSIEYLWQSSENGWKLIGNLLLMYKYQNQMIFWDDLNYFKNFVSNNFQKYNFHENC